MTANAEAITTAGIEIVGEIRPQYREILTPEPMNI
jgi:hypothetical protein